MDVTRLRRQRNRIVAAAGTLAIAGALVAAIGVVPHGSQAAPIPGSANDRTFPAGSLIVDLGQMAGTTQTITEGLKPYGFVFDLLVNRKIPVSWIIANGKVAGNPPATGKTDADDFTTDVIPNGSGGPVTKTYRSSAFVIAEPVLADLPPATLTSWRATGVVIDVAQNDFTAPEFAELTSWPKAVLDDDNGNLAIPYYQNAGIPSSLTPAVPAGAPLFETYAFKSPAELNPCDDIYVMPHADPVWATHQNLLAFNDAGGAIWAGCHAISVLEQIDDPIDADTDPDLNFLTTNGLLDYSSHSDGTIPYAYTADGSDPIMQFLGVVDAATQNGSEQIVMPGPTSAWLPTTNILAWDPTQANVPGDSPGEAAVLAYGRGFGDPSNGVVMYEAGHRLDSGSDDDVAAQRAFLNEHLLAGYERSPSVSIDAPVDSTGSGTDVTVTANVTDGSAPYSYSWESSCGGTFDVESGTLNNAGSFDVTFTAPTQVDPADCNLRLIVTDDCGHGTFGIDSIQVLPPDAPVANDDSYGTAHDTNVVDTVATNDTYTGNATFTVTSGPPASDGDLTLNADGSFTFDPDATFSGVTTFEYELCLEAPFDALCDSATVTITVGPGAVDDAYVTEFDVDVSDSVATNDSTELGSTFSVTSGPPASDGDLTLFADGSFIFDPADTFSGTTTFDYQVCLPEPNDAICASATVTITVGPDAVDDAYVIEAQDGTLDGDLSPNDAYPPNATFTLVDPPLNGIVTLDPSGTFTYTPDPGYSGPDSFTYDVCVPVPNGGTGGLPTEVCSEALATLGVTPSADLVITKSHNAALVPGGTVTYLIGVTNHGPSDVVGAHVTDQLPAGLSDATWICTSTIGAACSANSGIGSPNLYVDLPVATSATIEVLANVKADATGDIINTATIETPPGVTDPDPSSNSATDPGTIGQASGGALALTGSPSFAWAFWGFVLMAIGAGLVLMTRRARRRTSS